MSGPPRQPGAAPLPESETLGPPPTPGRLVVGVSGSDASARALAWAIDHADRRGWSVDVVTAWPDLGEPFIHEVPGHYCDSRGRAVEGLRRAMARCRTPRQDTPVRVFVENADPPGALAARSRGADLLVVGSSGSGRSRRRGLPAVGEICRLVAECPVVVVGTEDEDDADVPPREVPRDSGRSST